MASTYIIFHLYSEKFILCSINTFYHDVIITFCADKGQFFTPVIKVFSQR